MKRFEVKTTAAQQMVDITGQIKSLVRGQNISSGTIVVFVPHTTCGVTINENADPTVKEDLIDALEGFVSSKAVYKHAEGNSHAHIKAGLMGSSVTVFVESSTLVLGTWQGIFLAEFDGPRQRSVLVKIIPD